MFPEATNLFIHGRDATSRSYEGDGVTFIHFLMMTSYAREVRCVKPNNGKEGLLVGDSLVNKGKHAIHNHTAIIAFEVIGYLISLNIPIKSSVGFRFLAFFDVFPAEAFTFPFIVLRVESLDRKWAL